MCVCVSHSLMGAQWDPSSSLVLPSAGPNFSTLCPQQLTLPWASFICPLIPPRPLERKGLP